MAALDGPGAAAVEYEGRAGASTDQDLSRLTPRTARDVFARLVSPDLEEMSGRWDGRMVGRWWLRWLQRATSLPTPLRGWCGKEIEPSGQVRNLVRRRGAIRPSVACAAAPGSSVVDGRRALIVDYAASGSPLVASLHGEIRWLDQGERVLGLVMVRPGGRTLATFPFEMTRSDRA